MTVGEQNKLASFVTFFVFFLTLLVLFTNQIHKWSHTPNPNRLLGMLQSMHIILNPKHHKIHHTPPFNKYYCITTGWMNPFLNYIQFFPRLEKLITKYTKALPRRDDIGSKAAEKII